MAASLKLSSTLDRAGVDLLDGHIDEDVSWAHEGDTGALELFHPCAEREHMTKYQALFDASPEFDRYRLAFILSSCPPP